jgi:hypothetical protein
MMASEWKAEAHIDEILAGRLIAEQFPGAWTDLGHRIGDEQLMLAGLQGLELIREEL